MGDLGFWALAQEDPDYLALVTPDGDEVKAGELLGHANQVVHALRARGFDGGDVVATLLPNCTEMIEVYLAALQTSWYLVRWTTTWWRPRWPTSSRTRGPGL